MKRTTVAWMGEDFDSVIQAFHTLTTSSRTVNREALFRTSRGFPTGRFGHLFAVQANDHGHSPSLPLKEWLCSVTVRIVGVLTFDIVHAHVHRDISLGICLLSRYLSSTVSCHLCWLDQQQ